MSSIKNSVTVLLRSPITLFINAIEWYQKTISPDHGVFRRSTCRFTPTCSEYTKEALIKHGYYGILLGVWRISRCNPLTEVGTIDKVP